MCALYLICGHAKNLGVYGVLPPSIRGKNPGKNLIMTTGVKAYRAGDRDVATSWPNGSTGR